MLLALRDHWCRKNAYGPEVAGELPSHFILPPAHKILDKDGEPVM